MAGLRSWLGLADDDGASHLTLDPVQKALGLLGQGGSAPEASYNDPTAGGTLSQPLPSSPEPPYQPSFAPEQAQAQDPFPQPLRPGTERPIINDDGSVTTERSITVTEPDLNGGRATNIPTVWNGRIVSDDEAVQNAARSGAAFPSFGSVDEAVRAAEQRSRDLGSGRATSVGGASVPWEVQNGQPNRNRAVRGGPLDEGAPPSGSYNDPTSGGTLSQPLPPSPERAAPPWASAVDLGSRALGAVGSAATGLYDRRAAEIAAEPAAPDLRVPSATNPLAADLPQRNPLPVLGEALGAVGAGAQSVARQINPVQPDASYLDTIGRGFSNVAQGRTPAGRTPDEYLRGVTPRRDTTVAPEAAIRDIMDVGTNAPTVPAAASQAVADVADRARENIGAGRRALSDGQIATGLFDLGMGTIDVISSPYTVAGKSIDALLPTMANGPVSMGDALTNLDAIRDVRALATAGVRVTRPVVAALRNGTAVEDLISLASRGANTAADAVDRGLGALAANAGRVGAADARMAEQGSTQLPGTLGVISGNPLDANTAAGGHVVPPHVSDTLDFPVRVPTDPAVIRAIEAAGGSVDPERGVNLNVIRMQGPEAAGKPATRSSTFYTAGRLGEASPYAAGEGASVGGSERIEAPTTYRSPLVLSDAPGSNTGFSDAMRRLKAESGGVEVEAARKEQEALYQRMLQMDKEYHGRVQAGEDPKALEDAYSRVYDQYEVSKQRYETLLEQHYPVTGGEIDDGIRDARRAGPPGSPERAQALTDLVTRYGGDPAAIPHLLEVRGADHQESAWAIKENILAHNARAKGYDGVLTVQPRSPDPKEIAAHPAVKAAEAERFEINRRLGQIGREVDERAAALSPTLSEEERLKDPQIAKLVDEYNQLYKRRDQMPQALEDAKTQAYQELSTGKITELADFRESHNPTPSTSGQAWADAHQRVLETSDRADELAQAMDRAEFQGTPAEWKTARKAWGDARREYDAAVNAREALRGETPGYTLRSDLPRRPTGGPETASATAGALPGQSTDRLGAVNRVLGQGLVSSVSGGVGAQVNQQANPDDPYAGVKGFAAGALLPLAASKGAGALARRVGATVGREGGALATLGALPGPTGGPGGGLFDAFPAAATWYRRASARNAAEMAARNIAPASATDVVRSAVSSVGHGAMLGPSTAGVNTLQSLWNVGWALPKEPLRAAGRAISTGNASALREPGEMAFGAARGMSRLGEAVWDVVRGAGKYAPVPGHEPTSARVADPFTRALLSALEAPGRVFGGLPDAISGTIAEGSVAARRAAQKATDAGLSGADWEDEVDRLVAEAEAHRKAARAGSTAPPSDPDVADVVGAADKAGERAGLRQPLGTIGTQARKVAKLGDAPVIGEFVAPYFNSPWNAMLQQAERSPAGFFMNTQGSKFDKHYDAVVGSAAALALGDQLRKGNITVNGSGPTDPNERQAWTDRGNRPYSIKVGDRYVPNRVFGYAEGLLNAVGEYHDALAYRKPEADSRWVQQDAFARIGRLLKEQPYAAGYATIADMAQHGPAALAADLAARLTPGAATMRAIGTSQDPSERAPDRGAGVPLETEAYQRWQQSVGLRSGLPVAQDILGRPKENPQQGAAAFFPRAGVEKRDPVIEAFQEARVFPGDPPRTLSGAGVTDPDLKPELSPAEQRRWNEIRGEGLIRKVQPLIDSGKLASGTPEQRAKALEDAKRNAADYADVTLAREIGRDELVRRYEARKARKAAS